MIVVLFAWLSVLFVVALVLLMCKRKGAARRFAVESVVVVCVVAAILFLGPR